MTSRRMGEFFEESANALRPITFDIYVARHSAELVELCSSREKKMLKKIITVVIARGGVEYVDSTNGEMKQLTTGGGGGGSRQLA